MNHQEDYPADYLADILREVKTNCPGKLRLQKSHLLGIGRQYLFRVGHLNLISKFFLEIFYSFVMRSGPPHIVNRPKQGEGHFCFGNRRRRKCQPDA